MDPLQVLMSSSLVVWAIDHLKRAKWFPWLTKETQRANQLAAVIGAALTAAGIHFVVEPSQQAGTYHFAVSGLTTGAIYHFFVQLTSQQTVLKVYQIANVLRQIAGRLPVSIPPKE